MNFPNNGRFIGAGPKQNATTHARKVAADLADDRAEAEGIPVREAFEIEYEAIYAMHPVTISQWQVAA